MLAYANQSSGSVAGTELVLPRAPRTAPRAAKDDMPPYDGYEDEVAKRRISRDNVGVSFAKPTDIRTARLKQLLQDEDFAAAERESAAASPSCPSWPTSRACEAARSSRRCSTR